jgi:hypothetical protein
MKTPFIEYLVSENLFSFSSKEKYCFGNDFKYSAPYTGRLRRRDSDGVNQGPIFVAPPVRPMCLRLKWTFPNFQLIPAFSG